MSYPSKFTKERCEAILQSITDRVPNKYAAHANGLSEGKLYKWLREGLSDLDKDIDTPKAKFFISLNKIKHDNIKEHVDAIRACPERWQAHAWLLERIWWREFSPNGPLRELAKKIEEMELSAEIKDELHGEVKSVKKEQTFKE